MTDSAAAASPSTAGPAPLPSQPPRPKGLSLRRNFSWALAGNMAYQASQWLVLVILAKFLSVSEVGLYALAVAVSGPVAVFFSLNLRAVQVTDTRDEHHFEDFLLLQILMSVLSLVMIALLALLLWHNQRGTLLVVILVGVNQVIGLVRDVFLARHQRSERMDRVAASMFLLSTVLTVSLVLALWLTRSLLIALTVLGVARLVVLILWDRRQISDGTCGLRRAIPAALSGQRWESLLRLMRLALPLGISSLLLGLSVTIPRYFIAAYLGSVELGYFAAVLSLVIAGALLTESAGQSALPRLSHHYMSNSREFHRLLAKLVVSGAVVGICGLILALLVGRQLLTLFFTRDFAEYQPLLVWGMAYGILLYAIGFLGHAVTAMRRFAVQPIVNMLGFGGTVVFSWLLIPTYGLKGAVAALALGRVIFAAAAVYVIHSGTRRWSATEA